MKFLFDESADVRLKPHLIARGHDATSIVPDYGAGLPDSDVLAIAWREGRVLITADRDFGDLVFRHRQPHVGVILYRLGPTALATKLMWLDRLLARHGHDLDQFFVITRRGIRVRRSQHQ